MIIEKHQLNNNSNDNDNNILLSLQCRRAHYIVIGKNIKKHDVSKFLYYFFDRRRKMSLDIYSLLKNAFV